MRGVCLALWCWAGLVVAKDFGRLGEVYPVAEPDMLDTLTERAKSLVDSGAWAQEMDAFRQRVERNSQRPAPVEGIGKSIHYSERFFDPSVVLSGDLQDMDGRVFARQGEVINPLATVPFAQTLYFIDGDDADQVAWMQRQRPQTLMVKIILVNGDIPRTSTTLDSRVYFDQGGALSRRFGLTTVPVRITAAPSGLRLRVEAIPADDRTH
ncbi:type-F conjugative transfer system protein TraW [Sodalis endosymbiont of Spalangia cameroni]|uniref:type-F conjugative transfer system protein TraW n=1 Tax=Sodalis praecaptivus TaxID=1239307 RepID=UPI0031F932DB